ncbi:hypothetical protein [Kaistia defluvii]|uniref:Uncharacterized protein n=1 Tax=Kaistia defluvii TaxID=410841 RepID=A0ABV2QTR3_9HYPH
MADGEKRLPARVAETWNVVFHGSTTISVYKNSLQSNDRMRIPMSLSKSALGLALALLAAPMLLSASPASATSANDFSTSGIDSGPIPDWKVFGFDLSSVPNDTASLAAFKASLSPEMQLAISNRCRYNIAINPFQYSPKVRDFCWAR